METQQVENDRGGLGRGRVEGGVRVRMELEREMGGREIRGGERKVVGERDEIVKRDVAKDERCSSEE